MGKVTMESRKDLKKAFDLFPAYKEKSTKSFRPPKTLEDDFRRLLMHDVPHINFTFELVHDWFAINGKGYEPIYLRAQQTPIDWKSKIGNSDMSTNFKVTHDIPIYKGDMVIREDGKIFILNWNVQNHANNQGSQSTECNVLVQVTRYVPETTDDKGYLVEEAHREVIVPDLPCTQVEYAGRPDYSATQGIPGIVSDHLISVYMQWNPVTAQIKTNDEFVLNDYTYRVINISAAEVNIDRTHGILTLHAKRVAGSDLHG